MNRNEESHPRNAVLDTLLVGDAIYCNVGGASVLFLTGVGMLRLGERLRRGQVRDSGFNAVMRVRLKEILSVGRLKRRVEDVDMRVRAAAPGSNSGFGIRVVR